MFNFLLRKLGLGGGPKSVIHQVKVEVSAERLEQLEKSQKQVDAKISFLDNKTKSMDSTVGETLNLSRQNEKRLENIEVNMEKIIQLSEKLLSPEQVEKFEKQYNQIMQQPKPTPPKPQSSTPAAKVAQPGSEKAPAKVAQPGSEKAPAKVAQPGSEKAEPAPETASGDVDDRLSGSDVSASDSGGEELLDSSADDLLSLLDDSKMSEGGEKPQPKSK